MLFKEAIEAVLSDDLETGKLLLRDYVNATVGFDALAEDMQKDPKSLMRMLSAKGDPRADNLLAMVARLKQREGVKFTVTQETASTPNRRGRINEATVWNLKPRQGFRMSYARKLTER